MACASVARRPGRRPPFITDDRAFSAVDLRGTTETGECVATFDTDYSIFQDTWTIRDGETEATLAKITSRGAVVTLARNLLPFGELVPHNYGITDAVGGHVGRIDGQLSLRDTYDITIEDASDVPRDAVVAAAMVIDAIQGAQPLSVAWEHGRSGALHSLHPRSRMASPYGLSRCRSRGKMTASRMFPRSSIVITSRSTP